MLQAGILTRAHTGSTPFFKAHEVNRLSGGSHRGPKKDVFDHSALYMCMKFLNTLKNVGLKCIQVQQQITKETTTRSALHSIRSHGN